MKTNVGMILAVLFLLPFVVVGIVTGGLMIKAFLAGDISQGFFLMAFSVAFGGVGIGLLVALVVGKRGQQELEMRKAAYPSEPWRWKKEWEGGRIQNRGTQRLILTWFFTTIWNAIAFPLIPLLQDEIFGKGNTAALVGLLFPLIGIGLAIYALSVTWSHLLYGNPVLVMNHLPGIIGGELSGRVEIRSTVRPSGGFASRLTCTRRTESGTGSDRSISEEICWQEEQKGINPGISAVAGGTSVPVEFLIPYECEPSSVEKGGISWNLTVGGAIPGLDFTSTFEVPVFRTPQSAPSQTEEKLRKDMVRSHQSDWSPSADSGISVQRTSAGGSEFVMAAGRNPAAAAGLGIFAAIWTGILVLVTLGGAPILVSIVLGIFDLIFLAVVVQFMFTESRIVVEEGHVSVRWYVFGLMFGKRVPCAEIEHVRLKVGAQAGNTIFHSIALVKKGGSSLTAGGLIRNKRQADWFAEALNQAIIAEQAHP